METRTDLYEQLQLVRKLIEQLEDIEMLDEVGEAILTLAKATELILEYTV